MYNLDSPNSLLPLEFQAIILVGSGTRLYPLTEDMPKALLPIANKPMIYYPLQFIEKTIITDVIIACFPRNIDQIRNYVHEVYETNLKIQLVEVPEGHGTAESLRTLRPLIKSDFLVMGCDLITDIPPHMLINAHRTLNSSMTAFFFDSANLENVDRVNKEDAEIVGIQDMTSRLLITLRKSDLQDDEINLRRSLMNTFPLIHLHSKLRDGHLYIFKNWVIDLVVKNKLISSIKNDLVPLLLLCQHRDAIAAREGIEGLQLESPPDIFANARHLSLTSNYTSKPSKVTCSAVVYRKGFTARANAVWSYGEINRHLIKSTVNLVPDTTDISIKTQVGSDCLVGASSIVGERCSLKRSVIGNHVQIGKNCKITNSVLMDYTILEDGVKMDNCIVCVGAKVGSKSELKECEVAGGFAVPVETHAKGEHFFAI